MYRNVTLLINENGELSPSINKRHYITHTFGKSTTVVIPRQLSEQYKLFNANVSIEPVPEKRGVLIRSIEERLTN
jgi:hypothetical protein